MSKDFDDVGYVAWKMCKSKCQIYSAPTNLLFLQMLFANPVVTEGGVLE